MPNPPPASVESRSDLVSEALLIRTEIQNGDPIEKSRLIAFIRAVHQGAEESRVKRNKTEKAQEPPPEVDFF